MELGYKVGVTFGKIFDDPAFVSTVAATRRGAPKRYYTSAYVEREGERERVQNVK